MFESIQEQKKRLKLITSLADTTQGQVHIVGPTLCADHRRYKIQLHARGSPGSFALSVATFSFQCPWSSPQCVGQGSNYLLTWGNNRGVSGLEIEREYLKSHERELVLISSALLRRCNSWVSHGDGRAAFCRRSRNRKHLQGCGHIRPELLRRTEPGP